MFFEELCTETLINRRTTYWDHPKADDLAEQVVQTSKRGLKKYGLPPMSHWVWDLI